MMQRDDDPWTGRFRHSPSWPPPFLQIRQPEGAPLSRLEEAVTNCTMTCGDILTKATTGGLGHSGFDFRSKRVATRPQSL
jgi:hypothetical protein